MSEEEKELPRGWVKTNFSNVCCILSDKGKKLKQKQYLSTGKYPVIDQGDSDIAGFTDDETLVFDGQFPIVAFGDHTRRFKKISKKFVVGADGVKLFKPSSHLNFDYILYLLRISKFEDRGYSRHFQFVKKLNLSIAPLAEQSRIVDKIDELFSSIEAGERAIARARTALTRYRKAVLKAAVTGELTADWRAENPSTETADALLTRILKARYNAWEKAELEKLDAKGKARPETEKEWAKFRARYKPPVELDIKELPELPKGWVNISGEYLFWWSSGDFLPKKKMIEGDVPVYGGNGINGKHNVPNRVHPTIVIGRVGVHCGNIHLVNQNCWITDNAIFAIIISELVDLKFSEIVMRSARLGDFSQGGAQPFVNQTVLNEFRIKFPPLDEQAEIVSRVEEALSKADKVEATLEAQAQSARALKQAVLKTAFKGKLVPQNPNDEPASELLKRIKAEI